MSDNTSGIFLNTLFSTLLRKIRVPSDFHSQVEVIKEMQKNDVTGLVDVLTDFSVNAACTDFTIETNNSELTRILKIWLEEINKDYKGRIPSGIQELAKEYFKERWKYSSLPILKVGEWGKVGSLVLPTKLFFVDGGAVHTKEKKEGKSLSLISYDYYDIY